MIIFEGVSYNEEFDDFSLDFQNDDKEDIVYLTYNSLNNKLHRFKGLSYYYSFISSKNITKGMRDKFIRAVKYKSVNSKDYKNLINVGVSYLEKVINLNEIDFIIAPQSSSSVVNDILNSIKIKYPNILIYDNFFIKNEVENIQIDFNKFINSQKGAVKQFVKRF